MRAFKIKNSDPTKFVSGIRVDLENKLNNVIAKDRDRCSFIMYSS